jgi:hypothetical protein
MHQSVIFVGGAGCDAFAMEASEERGRAGAVEAFIVVENANPQDFAVPLRRKTKLPELFSIKGKAGCVKAGRFSQILAGMVFDSERPDSIVDMPAETAMTGPILSHLQSIAHRLDRLAGRMHFLETGSHGEMKGDREIP